MASLTFSCQSVFIIKFKWGKVITLQLSYTDVWTLKVFGCLIFITWSYDLKQNQEDKKVPTFPSCLSMKIIFLCYFGSVTLPSYLEQCFTRGWLFLSKGIMYVVRLLLSLVLRDFVKIPYFFNDVCTFFSVIWTEWNIQSFKLRGVFKLSLKIEWLFTITLLVLVYQTS